MCPFVPVLTGNRPFLLPRTPKTFPSFSHSPHTSATARPFTNGRTLCSFSERKGEAGLTPFFTSSAFFPSRERANTLIRVSFLSPREWKKLVSFPFVLFSFELGRGATFCALLRDRHSAPFFHSSSPAEVSSPRVALPPLHASWSR